MLGLLRRKESRKGASGPGITTLIGADVVVRGAMDLPAGIKIEGRVQGDVLVRDPDGMVLLHADAQVVGNITAGKVFVGGRVQGNIAAREVHLYAGANVEGDVTYKRIVIHDGAILNGHVCRHQSKVIQQHRDVGAPYLELAS